MRLQIDRADGHFVPTDSQIQEAVDALLADERISVPDGLLEIRLSPEHEITRLNSDFLGETSVTDVIAFELLELDPATGELIVGSIAVNHDLAVRNATEFVQNGSAPHGRTSALVCSEILLYILHGVLHFAGFEDEFPEDRREMFDMAHAVLSRLGHELIPYDRS
jgi:probable rRNA maturation factor